MAAGSDAADPFHLFANHRNTFKRLWPYSGCRIDETHYSISYGIPLMVYPSVGLLTSTSTAGIRFTVADPWQASTRATITQITGQGMNHAFRHLQHVATDPSVTDTLPIGSTVWSPWAHNGLTTMRSSTLVTPGARQATRSASSRSSQERTFPLSMTSPPLVSTVI